MRIQNIGQLLLCDPNVLTDGYFHQDTQEASLLTDGGAEENLFLGNHWMTKVRALVPARV